MNQSSQRTDGHEQSDTSTRSHASSSIGRPLRRRIAICIDDLGLHDGVNQAAFELAQLGRASALSALVGAPAWPSAAAALRQGAGANAEIGLHFDLTLFPTDRRSRRPLAIWLVRAAVGTMPTEAIRREVHAQLDAFEAGTGRAPEFVDGHQHVHQLRGVRDVLVEALCTRYGTSLPWLRVSCPRSSRRSIKSQVISLAGAAGLAELADRRAILHNRQLLGVYDFRGGPDRYRHLARAWLGAARDGDLLMCHPAAAEPAEPAGPAGVVDPIDAARRWEFVYWASHEAGATLRAEQVVVEPLTKILRQTS